MSTPLEPVCAIDVITRPENFIGLEPDWNRLWSEGKRREVFSTFAWARAWVRTYGTPDSLRIAVARRQGTVSAILPLALQQGDLRFIGTPHSDYCDIVCDAQTGAAELRKLVRALAAAGGWDRLTFSNLSERSRLFHLCLEADFRLGLPHALRPGHKCPTVVADGDAARVFGELLRKENPKRCEKHLKERGTLDFAHLERREEIQSHLDGFFDQHRLRRAVATNSAGMFGHEEQRRFFRNILQEFDPATTLRFAVLRVAGRVVACHFGFELDQRYVWYVPTFDIDFWDCRPGLVLLRNLFEYALGRRLREFDFTIGDEEYKNRFANQAAQNYELTLYPTSARGYARLGRERLKRWVHGHRGPAAVLARFRAAPRDVRRQGLARTIAGRRARRAPLLVFSLEAGPDAVVPPKAALSELVRRWLNTPTFTDPQTVFERIRNGHFALLSAPGGALAHLAWIAPPDRAPLPHPPQPGYVVYETWSADGAKAADLQELLRGAAALGARAHVPVWLCCGKDGQALANAARAAGGQKIT
ncbi:MAG: GNAT family N-acetyltransferase, partial [Verrucomicrobiota bacterium]